MADLEKAKEAARQTVNHEVRSNKYRYIPVNLSGTNDKYKDRIQRGPTS